MEIDDVMAQDRANGRSTRRGPMDSRKREHVGYVQNVFWADETDTAVMAKLRDGVTVKGKTSRESLETGDRFLFLGHWEDHPKYGMQFQFDTFVKHEPETLGGVVRYLTKHCEGIGDKLARKLYDAYGSDTCEVIRENMMRVVDDGILKADVAKQASDALNALVAYERTKIALFGMFDRRGFPGKLTDAAIAKWGGLAPDIIRRNPFSLLVHELPGCGFKRTDKLYLDMGKSPKRLKRQGLCAWDAVRNDRGGHTWVDSDDIKAAVENAIGNGADPERAIELMVRSRWLARRKQGSVTWLAEASKARNERTVADALERLLAGGDMPTWWPEAPLPAPPGNPEKRPSDHQNAVWEKIRTSPVAILCGSPGVGKTFLLASVLRKIVNEFGPGAVAVACPTGKAAVRCTQALSAQGVGVRATTIHTLLQIRRLGHDGGGWNFQYGPDRPLPYKFIIIDEVSMCDTDLMASLLSACSTPANIPARPEQILTHAFVDAPRCRRCHRPLNDEVSMATGYGPLCRRLVDPSSYSPVRASEYGDGERLPALPEIPVIGTHVLFVGDPYQLPPVGHGAPLRDMMAAGVPYGELTEIRRNAGMIVRGCHAIKSGEAIEFASRVDLDDEDPKNLLLAPTRTEAQSVEVLETILGGALKRFNPTWQTQVLVAVNKKGMLSRTALNDRLQKLLNPNGTTLKGHPFRLNDKVICLKNSWMDIVTESFDLVATNQEVGDAKNYRVVMENNAKGDLVAATHYVANGEIGRVIAISQGLMIVRFSESDTLVRIPVGKMRADDDEEEEEGASSNEASKGRGCQCDLAYAITTHKAQGGEHPCVIIVVDEGAGMVASREFHYTAISRASKLCIVIGRQETLERQIQRISLRGRKTFLADLIREYLK